MKILFLIVKKIKIIVNFTFGCVAVDNSIKYRQNKTYICLKHKYFKY